MTMCTEEEKRPRRPRPSTSMTLVPLMSSLALVLLLATLVVDNIGSGGCALAFAPPPASHHVSLSASKVRWGKTATVVTRTRTQAKILGSGDDDEDYRSTSKIPSSASEEEESPNGSSSSGRRSFVKSLALSAAAASFVGLGAPTRPAWAKGEQITHEAITSAFAAVRSELEDTSFTEMGKGGGVAFLEKCIDSGEWETIKTFTKFYDQELRKAKMGRARKLMTDGKMKGDAIQLSNAVTFDLIGINRASRVEDAPEARRYLGELREDLKKFLDYEGQMEIPSNT